MTHLQHLLRRQRSLRRALHHAGPFVAMAGLFALFLYEITTSAAFALGLGQ